MQSISTPYQRLQCHIFALKRWTNHDYRNGGHIRSESNSIPFSSFEPGSILTIMDICNSPNAAAIFSGTYPADPKAFKWKKVFKDPTLLVPVACDKTPSTWGFRVGFQDQDENDSAKSSWSRMSVAFGDAVSCSVIYAAKLWVDRGSTGTMDDYFQQVYNMLRKGYLISGTNTPRGGYSTLTPLQTLIENGSLRVNQAAFDCLLFQRVGKWFLAHERNVRLNDSDADLAHCLEMYVVNEVSTWHQQHPDSMDEFDESRKAWSQLLQILGPFRHQLQSIELVEQATSSEVVVKTTDDGLLFEL